MKIQTFIRKNYLFGFVILITIALITATYLWQYTQNQANIDIHYYRSQINNLEEQIRTLRKDYNVIAYPSPKPADLTFVKADYLNNPDTFKLKCYKEEEGSRFDWFSDLKSKLKLGEKIETFCLNTENPLRNPYSVALIASKQDQPSPPGPTNVEFRILIYGPTNKSIQVISTKSGNYLGGYCYEIVGWVPYGYGGTGGLYFKCGGGDGDAKGGTTIYKNAIDIVEDCTVSLSGTTCKKYCDSTTPCQKGFFCNLENNSCTKSCSNIGVYCETGGICKPKGPVLGCF